MSVARGRIASEQESGNIVGDGERVLLPRGGRCLAGQLAEAYLNAAMTPADQRRRTARLARFSAHFVWGVSLSALARAFNLSTVHVSREVKEVSRDLIELDRLRNLGADAYLWAKEDFENGEGI
jgi:hypothetical protein